MHAARLFDKTAVLYISPLRHFQRIHPLWHASMADTPMLSTASTAAEPWDRPDTRMTLTKLDAIVAIFDELSVVPTPYAGTT